jgi:uncharacterized membrane protein
VKARGSGEYHQSRIKSSLVLSLCLVAMTLAIAVAARKLDVGGRVLTYDESTSWRITTYSWSELLQRLRHDAHPPLHYLLWKGWTSFAGTSVAALRGPSIIFGTLAIAFLILLLGEAKPLLARHALCGGAIVAALVAGTNILQVQSGATARMYALGSLLAMVTAWLLLKALRAESWQLVWWTA